jgi:hypothetical protein
MQLAAAMRSLMKFFVKDGLLLLREFPSPADGHTISRLVLALK